MLKEGIYEQIIYKDLNDNLKKLDPDKQKLKSALNKEGKTVITGFDYKDFTKTNKKDKNRLLFIAHREEILKQSRDTFRAILKDNNFGDLYVGGNVPDSLDHLFMSIQSFNSSKLYEKTTEDFYDFIIVDEFHHAEAPTLEVSASFLPNVTLKNITYLYNVYTLSIMVY